MGYFSTIFCKVLFSHDSIISAYNEVDYSHLRQDDVEDVSPSFLPILSKVELHLQQFKSALLDDVVRLVLRHFAKQIDTVLMDQARLSRKKYQELLASFANIFRT